MALWPSKRHAPSSSGVPARSLQCRDEKRASKKSFRRITVECLAYCVPTRLPSFLKAKTSSFGPAASAVRPGAGEDGRGKLLSVLLRHQSALSVSNIRRCKRTVTKPTVAEAAHRGIALIADRRRPAVDAARRGSACRFGKTAAGASRGSRILTPEVPYGGCEPGVSGVAKVQKLSTSGRCVSSWDPLYLSRRLHSGSGGETLLSGRQELCSILLLALGKSSHLCLYGNV